MAGVVKPRALAKGDTVALVAPSEPTDKIKLGKISHFFEKNGYRVKPGKNILEKIGDYAAGKREMRADDINSAFADPEVKAVFPVDGGMVASQILEKIDWEMVKNNPKILAGYSDSTTLQLAVLAKAGLVSFHTPNALSLPDFQPKGYTMTSFWKMLVEPVADGIIKPQSLWQEARAGSAEGVLFGGNLSCICKLLGTNWDPIRPLTKIFGDDQKFIFFWEEDYEQFSEINRNLWQLRNTGFFEKVSAMVVGKLTAVKEIDYQDFPTKKQLILEATNPFDFPVLYGVDFGHEVPKATIPIGVKARLETKSSLLEVLEPAVI